MRLLHWPEDRLAPTGGQSGYLYNLNIGLRDIGATNYRFLPPEGLTIEGSSTLRRMVPERVKDIRRLRNTINLPAISAKPAVDYNDYEAVHFHWTKDCYAAREALECYGGKVVLTSHTPCVCHQEFISKLNPMDARRNADKLKPISVIDEYSFSRADYVVFPCPEAEEPYFNTWPDYERYRDESKLRYVPTGIVAATARVGRDQVRGECGIPSDAFVVSYVGRHNEIKGYDILKGQGDAILADGDTWILNAGKEGPLYAPRHPRWIEVGWTNDPHSIIAAADVFILPNRETFFDLIMLEVLSLGQVVIASRTGGNRFFEKFDSPAILLYDAPEEIPGLVEMIRNENEGARESRREAARALYDREFSCDVFARRYDELMNEICDA